MITKVSFSMRFFFSKGNTILSNLIKYFQPLQYYQPPISSVHLTFLEILYVWIHETIFSLPDEVIYRVTSVDPMTIIGVRWQRSSVRNHDNGARLRIICATKPGELTHINGHQRPGLSLLPGLEFGARGRHAVWWGYTLNLSSQADSVKSEIYKRMRI